MITFSTNKRLYFIYGAIILKVAIIIIIVMVKTIENIYCKYNNLHKNIAHINHD